VAVPDARTERLRAYPVVWRDTGALTDEQLAKLVQEDRIDVLVDLTGHTRGDRLLVFAQRAAPVQITWNGYANTTGLSAMDYRITDGYADPPGATEHLHSEKLMRMPEIYMPFAVPVDAPPVGPLPALEKGHVTFGSFNTLSKVTPGVLRLWARVLQKIADAELVMLAVPQGRTRERIAEAFAAAGVDETRIHLRERASHREFMAAHNEVDIALDTHPQSGTTTTAHSLWMGVPVVTIAGKTHAGRVGASMLSNAGLPHLVGASEDDYVSIAVRLAQDVHGLQALRAMLRDQLRNAPNMNGARFTRFLEAAYEQAWHDWYDASA
jgi:predicted O-linked N-acetylglucosamine transferase (SPINDLY family)